MLYRETFIYLLTLLVIFLSALSGGQWLLIHYPNMLIGLTAFFISLLLMVGAFRLYANFQKAKSNKGVLIGKLLIIGNETITFRKKHILNKYIVFPEINGKRDDLLYEFITSPEEREVTAAVNRLISSINFRWTITN